MTYWKGFELDCENKRVHGIWMRLINESIANNGNRGSGGGGVDSGARLESTLYVWHKIVDAYYNVYG